MSTAKPVTIVTSAIRFPDPENQKDIIILGVRHHDALMKSVLHIPEIYVKFKAAGFANVEEGFVDSRREFHDRVSALAVVKAAGQTFYPARNGSETELYSEGVW